MVRNPLQDTKILPKTDNVPLAPTWILAPYEDKEIRDALQEQANKKCAREFFEFGSCCHDNQFSFSWKCADVKKAMNDCVAFWGSHKKYAEMREVYVEEKIKRVEEERKKRRENENLTGQLKT